MWIAEKKCEIRDESDIFPKSRAALPRNCRGFAPRRVRILLIRGRHRMRREGKETQAAIAIHGGF